LASPSTGAARSWPPNSLHAYLTIAAERQPDAGALVYEDRRLTYADLETSSNRLARLLLDMGCSRGDRVCLLVPKVPEAIIAMLAALKAECVYVPIDIASPAPRVEKIIGSADARVLLTSQEASNLVDNLFARGNLRAGTVVGSIGNDALAGEAFSSGFAFGDADAFSSEPVVGGAREFDPAHILFTSGSTGIPKGVVITHSNVIHFIDWAVDYFGIDSTDRVSGHPPLHFDLSTFDIYGALAAGAELHLVPSSLNLLPHKLAGFIDEHELTQWFSAPSLLTYLTKFDAVGEGAFPHLRRLLWCGEVMPTPTLIHLMRRLPHLSFTNLYGPTEATIASSYYTVPSVPRSETESIPIGVPCAGESLHVLDEDLNELPVGETGMLYIGGVGLSPGYWRDEEKTSEAFLERAGAAGGPDRVYRTGDLAHRGEDGLFYFHGRLDTQIKTRGYRIELGEIEAALNALGRVQESAVVAIEGSEFETISICCAYAPLSGASLEPREIAAELRRVLPPYMIPTRWEAFDHLPKNVNGKIDRAHLKELFVEAPKEDGETARGARI
jgi:amino acid adenylation domain-containing protein